MSYWSSSDYTDSAANNIMLLTYSSAGLSISIKKPSTAPEKTIPVDLTTWTQIYCGVDQNYYLLSIKQFKNNNPIFQLEQFAYSNAPEWQGNTFVFGFIESSEFIEFATYNGSVHDIYLFEDFYASKDQKDFYEFVFNNFPTASNS